MASRKFSLFKHRRTSSRLDDSGEDGNSAKDNRQAGAAAAALYVYGPEFDSSGMHTINMADADVRSFTFSREGSPDMFCVDRADSKARVCFAVKAVRRHWLGGRSFCVEYTYGRSGAVRINMAFPSTIESTLASVHFVRVLRDICLERGVGVGVGDSTKGAHATKESPDALFWRMATKRCKTFALSSHEAWDGKDRATFFEVLYDLVGEIVDSASQTMKDAALRKVAVLNACQEAIDERESEEEEGGKQQKLAPARRETVAGTGDFASVSTTASPADKFLLA